MIDVQDMPTYIQAHPELSSEVPRLTDDGELLAETTPRATAAEV